VLKRALWADQRTGGNREATLFRTMQLVVSSSRVVQVRSLENISRRRNSSLQANANIDKISLRSYVGSRASREACIERRSKARLLTCDG
jgi:hypothetical protein